MSKFKFGDKVWHDEFKLGIVLYKDETCDNEYMIYFERDDYHTTMKDCELTKVSDWMQCSERMPEHGDMVLVFNGSSIEIDALATGEFDFECWCDSVTHWMPLPEIPEVKE